MSGNGQTIAAAATIALSLQLVLGSLAIGHALHGKPASVTRSSSAMGSEAVRRLTKMDRRSSRTISHTASFAHDDQRMCGPNDCFGRRYIRSPALADGVLNVGTPSNS